MDYRYQLENKLGKEKITCPECGHSETFTRFVDTITGELLSDEYGMCDRAYKCAYVNRPPQNYITDEPTEFNYSDNSIYDTGFIKENWTPENICINAAEIREPNNLSVNQEINWDNNFVKQKTKRKPSTNMVFDALKELNQTKK